MEPGEMNIQASVVFILFNINFPDSECRNKFRIGEIFIFWPDQAYEECESTLLNEPCTFPDNKAKTLISPSRNKKYICSFICLNMFFKTINIITNTLLLFILILGMSVHSLAKGDDLFFRHILSEDGLSNNVVYDILEDEVGFIWIATRNGLNRFDGSGFRVYDQFKG
ncbi:MAG TPA: two-component regulator propeller domain-containing protein, partial [Bacteroidales bacterium]|nr:two-component regulator propeller domain-containing protein [Bacteroidales bacterium]